MTTKNIKYENKAPNQVNIDLTPLNDEQRYAFVERITQVMNQEFKPIEPDEDEASVDDSPEAVVKKFAETLAAALGVDIEHIHLGGTEEETQVADTDTITDSVPAYSHEFFGHTDSLSQIEELIKDKTDLTNMLILAHRTKNQEVQGLENHIRMLQQVHEGDQEDHHNQRLDAFAQGYYKATWEHSVPWNDADPEIRALCYSKAGQLMV